MLSLAAAPAGAGGPLTAPASAAPPSTPSTTSSAEYQKPYSSHTWTHNGSDCQPGAVCELVAEDSWVDPEKGEYSTHMSYSRPADVPGDTQETAFGYSWQNITFKVPPHASQATATFTWAVGESQVNAQAVEGSITAQSGLGAYVLDCGSDCSVEPDTARVKQVRSADGVTGQTQTYASDTVTLTVTASGELPRRLTFRGYTYGVVWADKSAICTSATACIGTSAKHSGTGTALINAKLIKVHVNAQ